MDKMKDALEKRSITKPWSWRIRFPDASNFLYLCAVKATCSTIFLL